MSQAPVHVFSHARIVMHGHIRQVLTGIALGVHTCACVFWLCKLLSHPETEIEVFKEEFEINDDVRVQYAASFYFITTIITTIGFGDIVPCTSLSRLPVCACVCWEGGGYKKSGVNFNTCFCLSLHGPIVLVPKHDLLQPLCMSECVLCHSFSLCAFVLFFFANMLNSQFP